MNTSPAADPITLRTWLAFLVGRRTAIESLADSRAMLGVGALFVLSAGLAREYDGEDLLAEPWYLLIPFAASLASSLILFAWIHCILNTDGRSFFDRYRRLLTLFWATAPLAWLYATPVERFLPPEGGMMVNVWLLAIVASWRVVLMIRVVHVLTGASHLAATMMVMLYADAIVLAIMFLSPWPIIDVMGGIRLGPSARVVLDAKLTVMFWGVVTLPVWFFGSGVAISKRKDTWRWQDDVVNRVRRASIALWSLAVASVAAWCAVLPVTQPEQQLRRQAEALLTSGDVEGGLALLAAHPRDAFPPHWELPPQLGWKHERPPLLDVLDVLVRDRSPDWVREQYVAKLKEYRGHYHRWGFEREDHPIEDLERVLHILESLPETPDILAAENGLYEALHFARTNHPNHAERIRKVMVLAESSDEFRRERRGNP